MVRIQHLNNIVEQDQETDPTDARVQVLRISLGHARGDRGRKHDPRGPTHTRILPICPVPGAGCLKGRDQSHFAAQQGNLRQTH